MSTPDLSEFEARSRRHTQCVIAKSLEQLEEPDATNFAAALAAPHISENAIAGAFIDRGLPGRGGAVKRHRDGTCCCER
jgi:hypothetical protein